MLAECHQAIGEFWITDAEQDLQNAKKYSIKKRNFHVEFDK